MLTRRDKIIDAPLRVKESKHNGIKYKDLCQMVREEFPDFASSYIRENIILLDKFKPEKVYKPEKGLLRHVKYKGSV